jgi:hypothetical protein
MNVELVGLDQDLVIGSYIYLDGEAHVRAAVAMDAIANGLCELRPSTALAYLASPATCYPIPKEACADATARHLTTPWWHTPTSLLFGGWKKAECPEVVGEAGTHHYVYDGLSVIQGPNYALAKTMQVGKKWNASSYAFKFGLALHQIWFGLHQIRFGASSNSVWRFINDRI